MKTTIISRSVLFSFFLFFCVFFWDILEDFQTKSEIALLLIFFILFLIKKKKLILRKKMIILFLLLLFHGLINILIGNDSVTLLFIQLFSITFCFVAFDNTIKHVNMDDLIHLYWKFAVFTSVIGIIEEISAIFNLRSLVKFPILFTYTNFDNRVGIFLKISSICREPSFLGYVLAPAICMVICYYFAPEFVNKNLSFFHNRLDFLFILFAYLFTFSGVAYFGVAVMFLIIWCKKKSSFKKIVLPLVFLLLFLLAYLFIPDIKIRIDDTLRIFTNSNIESSSINLSSFTYYSNFMVVRKALRNTSGLGSGLGSYQIMFDRYNNAKWGENILSLNREDANSGFFRILTETGIFGVLLVLFFIFKYFPKKDSDKTVYSIALVSLFMMYLLRQGNYIHAGSILFICMYIKNYKEVMKNVQK